METLLTETSTNLSNPLDIDKLRERYINYLFDDHGKSILRVEYPSFGIDIYSNNLFIFLNDCEKKEMIPKWERRPSYVSEDMYNTPIYWPVILYVNRIDCMENFIGLRYVLVPSLNSIYKLLDDLMELSSSPISIYEDDDVSTAIVYKKYAIDHSELMNIQTNELLKDIPESFGGNKTSGSNLTKTKEQNKTFYVSLDGSIL